MADFVHCQPLEIDQTLRSQILLAEGSFVAQRAQDRRLEDLDYLLGPERETQREEVVGDRLDAQLSVVVRIPELEEILRELVELLVEFGVVLQQPLSHDILLRYPTSLPRLVPQRRRAILLARHRRRSLQATLSPPNRRRLPRPLLGLRLLQGSSCRAWRRRHRRPPRLGHFHPSRPLLDLPFQHGLGCLVEGQAAGIIAVEDIVDLQVLLVHVLGDGLVEPRLAGIGTLLLLHQLRARPCKPSSVPWLLPLALALLGAVQRFVAVVLALGVQDVLAARVGVALLRAQNVIGNLQHLVVVLVRRLQRLVHIHLLRIVRSHALRYAIVKRSFEM